PGGPVEAHAGRGSAADRRDRQGRPGCAERKRGPDMTMDDSRHDTGAHPGESAGYGTVPGSDTEALRRQIEQARADLSRNVNALGEAASPGTVARRQAEKVGDTVTGAGRRLK